MSISAWSLTLERAHPTGYLEILLVIYRILYIDSASNLTGLCLVAAWAESAVLKFATLGLALMAALLVLPGGSGTSFGGLHQHHSPNIQQPHCFNGLHDGCGLARQRSWGSRSRSECASSHRW